MALAGGPHHQHSAYSRVELLASGLHDAGPTAAVRLPVPENGLVFVLDHTIDEQAVGDTCDVYIQTLLDGTNWTDVVHFAQHLGNQGAERRLAKVLTAGAMIEFDQAAALVAGAVRHATGDDWRVNVEITDASGAAAFTFSVMAIPV